MKGCQAPKIPQTRNSLTKLLSYIYMLTLIIIIKKLCEKDWEERTLRPEGGAIAIENYYQTLKPVCLDGFSNYLGSVTPFRFFFCFNKVSLAVILCLSPPSYFEEREVFLEVHRTRGIVLGGGLYRFSTIPNLDEIQKVWADEILMRFWILSWCYNWDVGLILLGMLG